MIGNSVDGSLVVALLSSLAYIGLAAYVYAKFIGDTIAKDIFVTTLQMVSVLVLGFAIVMMG